MVATAPVNPQALKLARERRELSVSELARALAELDPSINVASLRARLDRIEHGRGNLVDRVVVGMLARFFEVSEDDMAGPPLWTWVAANGEFESMALRWLVFTTPERAYDARDQLAVVPGFLSGADLAPVFASDVHRVIAYNFGELPAHQRAPLLVVDPPAQELRELVVATVAIHGVYREDAAKALAGLSAAGELVSVVSLDALCELASRRCRHGIEAKMPKDVLERWVREESRLREAADWYRQERERIT